jgi:hypothetical protein
MSVKTLSCRAVALAVCALSVSSTASRGAFAAESAADKKRATAFLQEGAKLLDSKDYAAALVKFQEAYALVPSPKIQFNVGLAQEGLDRPAEATRAYQAYLQGATNDAASRRADAQARMKALRARVTFLQITTDVGGASVTVDGAEEGRTPLAQPLVLNPGPHHVVVQAAGGPPWARAIRGEPGGTLELQPSQQALTPPPAAAPAPPAPPPPLPLAREPATEPAPLVTTTPAPAEDEARPVYKKVWFWGLVAGVAAAATVSVVLFMPPKTDYTCIGMMPCLRAN